ncbi:MAG: GNAT family N-acetyltransferase [Streptosporangiales bacterium]|nr:GNAT family N-acetyltransferase [Streptosporangiales bacterium]
MVAADPSEPTHVVAHALLTRCHVGDRPTPAPLSDVAPPQAPLSELDDAPAQAPLGDVDDAPPHGHEGDAPGPVPALALAPCAVAPEHQRSGAGSAAIEAALRAAREQGERLVLVLGHPEYYPRFGFVPASRYGIRAPMDVPDEAMMALVLDDSRPAPSGLIHYPPPFGI